MQYVFLNGRFIRDRALQHALGEAYRGLLMTGRYPIAFVRLDIPADAVDVNVHPTKLEVRFLDSGRIYGHLLGTLRNRFLATDLTPQETLGDSGADAVAEEDDQQAGRMRRQFASWAKGKLGQPPAVGDGHAPAAGPTDAQTDLELRFSGDADDGGLRLNRLDRSWRSAGPGAAAGDAPSAEGPTESGPDGTGPAESGRPAASALQVHNRYLVTENEEGVVVIDQHALHERILYEELREKVLSGTVETQRLLVPEAVHLTPTEAAAVLETRQLLLKMGIDVEPFGGDTVIISGYPAMLANLSPEEVLRKVVEQLMAGAKVPDRRDLLDELLHTIACKAAIKAGDRLSAEEISALLQRRHLVRDAHHCPHGRPTALVFTREELDKRFKRV